ncbi:MAG: metallophosphoesterase [Sorangiineae bacterium]|nr:metallophosphoesterase [Polyangiaceae bacterium]MEB2321287.1 metallophosphoesterase [Sorangiineae bacterium]
MTRARSRVALFGAVLASSALAAPACDRAREPESRPAPAAPNRPPGAPSSAPVAPAASAAARAPATARLVAIGDLHGDLAQTRAALRLAGAIDEEDDWIGKSLIVVQTGDELDRGDDEEGIVALFESLAKKAERAGGRVVVLDGNHDVMNVQGDFRYVTRGGFIAFERFAPEPGAAPELERFPVHARGRAAAMRPGGAFALRLAERNVIEVVGDTVFVHGGVLLRHLDYGVERINRETRAWMRGEGPLPAVMNGEDAPTWARDYSQGEPSAEACDELGRVLARLGAKRMVVGHTVQEAGITSACDERVWRIDVGLSRYYGGKTAVLEIDGDRVRPLTTAK